VSGVTYAELAPCRSPIGLIQAMITSPPPISLSTPLASLTPCSPSLRLSNFPISSGSDASPLIPDLFHAQKVYIFKALEQDAFPRFLRAKAFSNLTPLSSFVRLIAGLFVLWGAFVLGFSLIFLDYKPKVTRLWVSGLGLGLGFLERSPSSHFSVADVTPPLGLVCDRH
jgi:hypothetical protein